MKKRDREIMEILEAFDTTGCAQSAAKLAGCDPKTVRRYAALREEGRSPIAAPRRGMNHPRLYPMNRKNRRRRLRARGASALSAGPHLSAHGLPTANARSGLEATRYWAI